MIKCKNCGKEFKEKNKGSINEKLFCCEVCKTRYNTRNQKNRIIQTKEYKRKAVMKTYYKDKSKFASRVITKKLMKQGKIEIPNKCKECKSIKNLEIHHEIYPTKTLEIIEAVNSGKIYKICRKCHNIKTRKLITDNDRLKKYHNKKKKLDKREIILLFLDENERASTSRIASYIASNQWLAERYLSELELANKIIKEKETNPTYWRKEK